MPHPSGSKGSSRNRLTFLHRPDFLSLTVQRIYPVNYLYRNRLAVQVQGLELQRSPFFTQNNCPGPATLLQSVDFQSQRLLAQRQTVFSLTRFSRAAGHRSLRTIDLIAEESPFLLRPTGRSQTERQSKCPVRVRCQFAGRNLLLRRSRSPEPSHVRTGNPVPDGCHAHRCTGKCPCRSLKYDRIAGGISLLIRLEHHLESRTLVFLHLNHAGGVHARKIIMLRHQVFGQDQFGRPYPVLIGCHLTFPEGLAVGIEAQLLPYSRQYLDLIARLSVTNARYEDRLSRTVQGTVGKQARRLLSEFSLSGRHPSARIPQRRKIHKIVSCRTDIAIQRPVVRETDHHTAGSIGLPGLIRPIIFLISPHIGCNLHSRQRLSAHPVDGYQFPLRIGNRQGQQLIGRYKERSIGNSLLRTVGHQFQQINSGLGQSIMQHRIGCLIIGSRGQGKMRTPNLLPLRTE